MAKPFGAEGFRSSLPVAVIRTNPSRGPAVLRLSRNPGRVSPLGPSAYCLCVAVAALLLGCSGDGTPERIAELRRRLLSPPGGVATYTPTVSGRLDDFALAADD